MPLLNVAAERIRNAVGSVAVTTSDRLPFKVEGSGDRVVQVLLGPAWATTRTNSAQFPILHVNVWADCARDLDGRPVRDDADQRAYQLWESVDPLFHDTGRNWESVISSYRASGPALTIVPNSDGAVLLTARYEVKA